jgi:hypothetical protein
LERAKGDMLRSSLSNTTDAQSTVIQGKQMRKRSQDLPEALNAKLRQEKAVWEAKIHSRLKEELSLNYYKYEKQIAGNSIVKK